ncbi:MAG: AAA family ATPase [Calditerrivibrio sp.]|nr:AAA family ATPase [Calditerrivibrio sp.]
MDLITSIQFNLLSRPHRFGKSLLVSTLEQVFKGNKDLFKGLWIYESDYDWGFYPVLKIDFSQI